MMVSTRGGIRLAQSLPTCRTQGLRHGLPEQTQTQTRALSPRPPSSFIAVVPRIVGVEVSQRRVFFASATANSQGQGTYVFDIESSGNPFIGIKTIKGNRPYQEDRTFTRIYTRQDSDNFPVTAPPLYYLSIADGHGGSDAVDYANSNLHENFNLVKARDALDILKRNFTLLQGSEPTGKDLDTIEAEAKTFKDPITHEQRLRLAFLKTDVDFASQFPTNKSGTTFSVALIQYDNSGAVPMINLIVGHVGDTSVILCDSDGRAYNFTKEHHGSVATERARIEAMGGQIKEMDGKLRVMGQLEPTRSIGDLAFKRVGVIADPEIVKFTYPAKDLAFLVLTTDGVSQSMTSQEIVDCVKMHKTPAVAADTLVNIAESLNVDDNKTCMVLKLEDWRRASAGVIPDFTKELRDRRLAKYVRGGPGTKPREKATDEDVEIYLGRSGSPEALRNTASDVFAYFKASKATVGNVKALTLSQIRQALQFGGFSLDDWHLDAEQKERTEQWKRDRKDPILRERETVRTLEKVFHVVGTPLDGKISQQQFEHGMSLLGVFVTDIEEIE